MPNPISSSTVPGTNLAHQVVSPEPAQLPVAPQDLAQTSTSNRDIEGTAIHYAEISQADLNAMFLEK